MTTIYNYIINKKSLYGSIYQNVTLISNQILEDNYTIYMNIFVNVTILDDFNQIFTYQLKYHNIQPDAFPTKEEPIPIVDVDKRTDKTTQ